MRGYGQFCALAKALDVVGDRWTLLIVRELMVRGRARYTDLRNGLPKIASNLLADRLRQLESAGIVRHENAPPPVATALYELTDRGLALRSVLREIGRWGAPLLSESDEADDSRGYWIGLPAELYLVDGKPSEAPVTLEIRSGDEPVTLMIGNGSVRARIGAAERPDAVLAGTYRDIARVLLSARPIDAAHTRGLRYKGDRSVLARLKHAD
ncbi:MAG: hypothetical protein NVSMB19_07690 [Vulcanimicrobiaceae bacterium]